MANPTLPPELVTSFALATHATDRSLVGLELHGRDAQIHLAMSRALLERLIREATALLATTPPPNVPLQ